MATIYYEGDSVWLQNKARNPAEKTPNSASKEQITDGIAGYQSQAESSLKNITLSSQAAVSFPHYESCKIV